MRYIVATYSNGYCGCDVEEYWAFPEDSSDEYISDYLNETIYDYAESYLPCNVDFEDEQDQEFYYENCYVTWHDLTQEEAEEIGLNNFSEA